MKVDKEQKRLKTIKLKYVLFPTKCDCCGEEYKREKMWHAWHYCQNCMHSAKEVLNEVDTDECCWGIAGIDSFFAFSKKDSTRMNLARERILKKMLQCQSKKSSA